MIWITVTYEDKKAEEAHAYTPGLKVKRSIIVEKIRRLPIKGEVLVEKGQKVDFDEIVARTAIQGEPMIIRMDELLGLNISDVPMFMLKKIGDKVEEGEVIARYSPFFGLFKKEIRSPITGTLESLSETTGQAIFRADPIPVEVNAYVKGRISEVLPGEGVVIQTKAAFIQGIFGIGGERHGELLIVADSSDAILTPDNILEEHKGKILVGGKLVTYEAMKKASDYGVKGIITGGIINQDITRFLGYEMGVAITGEEDINLTLVVTEGYGEMKISDRTFNLLKELNGKQVAINGATQIRAGVLRPEIIAPHEEVEDDIYDDVYDDELVRGMVPGTPIRIIADPYFGEMATVVSLPVQLHKVETRSLVRVLEAKLDNGETIIVPRANVEIIEE